MYRKILLAYDGTLEGAVALREGAILARQCGAEVFILSVAPDASGVQIAEGVVGGAVSQHMERYKEVLERGVARLTAFGMKPTARLAIGEPARAIGAFAKEAGVDLVVVGHQKRRLLERWWSGPSGAYISDYIDCTLVIARNAVSDEEFDARMKAAGGEA
jgi:nucleotide-binding universal stress UspA family protein